MNAMNPSIRTSGRQINARSEQTSEPITYKVDKMTFIVTPVYREGDGKTIHELLIDLMRSNSETH